MKTIHKRTRKGFTLLEILLVIAAIGILAAIVLVAINPNRQIAQVRNAERRSEVNTLYKALEQYLIDTGSYPAGITPSKRDICKTKSEEVGGSTNCSGKVDLRELVPNYIASIPEDPIAESYKVGINTETNRVSVEAGSIVLGQVIGINQDSAETTINNQIAVGSLTPTATPIITEGRVVYTNQARTQTYIDRRNTTRTCPIGYIAVPGNGMYGTSDFCVMKYEAKTGSATVEATTQAAGTPQVSISQTNAISACNANNTGGATGYGLINNAEWMTIARNIEAQSSNWTGGSVGSGGLWRGHSDSSPFNALAANTNDNLGYEGTGNTSPSIERRTHTLSNGEVIWDMSGNVWEWTSDTILGKEQPTGSSTGFTWRQYNTGQSNSITNFGTLSRDLVGPSNSSWGFTKNMGQIYSDGTSTNNTTFAFLRGGFWSGTTGAGVFTLALSNTPSSANFAIGFRCVVR